MAQIKLDGISKRFADGRPTLVDERETQRQARAAVHRLWPRVAGRAT